VTNTDKSFISNSSLEPVSFSRAIPIPLPAETIQVRTHQRRDSALCIAGRAGEAGTPANWRGCNTHNRTGHRTHTATTPRRTRSRAPTSQLAAWWVACGRPTRRRVSRSRRRSGPGPTESTDKPLKLVRRSATTRVPVSAAGVARIAPITSPSKRAPGRRRAGQGGTDDCGECVRS
jgi:hypothetical protein